LDQEYDNKKNKGGNNIQMKPAGHLLFLHAPLQIQREIAENILAI
jgi:hypothetical protein